MEIVCFLNQIKDYHFFANSKTVKFNVDDLKISIRIFLTLVQFSLSKPHPKRGTPSSLISFFSIKSFILTKLDFRVS